MATLSPDAIVESFIDQWRGSDLADKMPEPGVIANGQVVELNSIGVYGPHQRQGHASRALQMLTDVCDANGVTISLVARPLDPSLLFTPDCPASLSTKQLIDWYQKHGFVDTSEPGDDTHTMIRKPRTQ